MTLPLPPPWKGDFEGMRAHRYIRMLVPYSKTFYFIDRGRQNGINYEYGKALEKWLNKKYPLKNKRQRWHIVFIPVKRDQFLTDLESGKGDVAMGGLTITRGRMKHVDFTEPLARQIAESVVTAPGFPEIKMIEDLSGHEIMVRMSSSYYEHLQGVNERLAQKGLPPVRIIPANEWLESEDLLEMVNAGLIQATVVDRYLAELWQPLFNDMKITSVVIHDQGEIAWELRKNSPQLKNILNAFVREHRVGTTFGDNIVNQYVYNEKRVINATSTAEMQKFKNLINIFKQYSQTYKFDYLMLMAQGFQESTLNQNARSSTGAVGVMQLLPSTAADSEIGIKGIDKYADRNIEAGAKYLRLLSDKYLGDEELDPVNRTLMAFAAYNAGPGNLRKFRRLAEKSGKDKNVWFENVEFAAAKIVGQETVNYVSNIYKYYIAYRLTQERDEATHEGKL